jgi:hypothetical protein
VQVRTSNSRQLTKVTHYVIVRYYRGTYFKENGNDEEVWLRLDELGELKESPP